MNNLRKVVGIALASLGPSFFLAGLGIAKSPDHMTGVFLGSLLFGLGIMMLWPAVKISRKPGATEED